MNADNTPKSWQDLMRVTGLGRDAVKAAIVAGQLPGYLVGSRYVVPQAAYTAFCEGRWTPRPRTFLIQTPAPEFIHRRKESA